ncbi:transmembrane amino acid transporter protein-domain-containing protein [Aspergillus caelatus]|uniref:Transmembrane amino acid transporter protein-domain-containing protein n=1 Tax=Aspergillus caelatus TaxID=61420 RepID=A0A5N6ZYM0_9EURO|nr:transmembrane amino acid transporter protein-domain-containing protein [Aspergillus caelatus]KAE8362681.1 transmembrane amino acid transporter protein-domain-containing protein [Aspergillus caelatus]
MNKSKKCTDLFNQETGDVDFCGVSWQGAAILITKFQIGLGALSLPSTFHVLGFFPGILCFIILALITTVAGYMCGNARQYYPHMHSIGDAAELLFGKGARELVGAIYYVYLALVAGAGMLATSVALNTLSDHGACSMIFVAVTSASALVLGTGFRSLEKVSWLSWIGVAGIIVAIWITAIACLTQSRPAAAPLTGPINLDIRAFPNASFSEAMAAISSQLFTLGASGTFFSVSAEMRSPELFTRSLICGQSFIVITNIAISSIMYAKVGQYLASPALGSAGPLIKKVSYGIALPGLVVTAVLWSHVAAKYWFVRILRGTPHLQSNTVVHWSVWVGSMVVTVIFGFVIVGVVPFFDNFLSLVGALVNPVFTNIVPGFMLLYFLAKRPTRAVDGVQHVDTERSASVRKWLLEAFKAYRNGWKEVMVLILACFMILTGALIIVGGTYATVLVIKASYDEGRVSGVFSCADSS